MLLWYCREEVPVGLGGKRRRRTLFQHRMKAYMVAFEGWRGVAVESKKWNTLPPFSCSCSFFFFFLCFSCNGLLWFLPLLSGFFFVFGFLAFLPYSLLFVLPCHRVFFSLLYSIFPHLFLDFPLFIPWLFCSFFSLGKSPIFLASPFGVAFHLAFYMARINGCSPIRLFFLGRRISLRVLIFCWDLDARFYPSLPMIVIFMKIGIDLCVLIGLGCWHFNFFPFFVGGFAASIEEKEELCMVETVLFWTGNDHISIWSLKFPNSAFKPLIM